MRVLLPAAPGGSARPEVALYGEPMFDWDSCCRSCYSCARSARDGRAHGSSAEHRLRVLLSAAPGGSARPEVALYGEPMFDWDWSGALRRLSHSALENEKSPNRKTVSCPFSSELHGIGQALCAVLATAPTLAVATSVSGLPLRVCCCRTHECRCIFVIEKSRSPCCAWGSKK